MIWNVQWFGAKGIDGPSADDTETVQAAVNTAHTRGGGEVFVPVGVFVTDGLKLYSNITLRGSSAGGSILKQKSLAVYVVSVNQNDEAPPSPADNQKNICIRDLTFEGLSGDGFLEQMSLLNLNGVTNVLVERCRFLSPQGDAVYIGSTNVAGQEAHNLNVIIRDCYFDGSISRIATGLASSTDRLLDRKLLLHPALKIRGPGGRHQGHAGRH